MQHAAQTNRRKRKWRRRRQKRGRITGTRHILEKQQQPTFSAARYASCSASESSSTSSAYTIIAKSHPHFVSLFALTATDSTRVHPIQNPRTQNGRWKEEPFTDFRRRVIVDIVVSYISPCALCLNVRVLNPLKNCQNSAPPRRGVERRSTITAS